MITSCLTSDLDELPTFDEANITNMRFEYRWIDNSNEFSKLGIQSLDSDVTIDTIANTVNCIITVPETKDDFTDEIRADVTLSNILGFADISTASIIKPMSGAPVLGNVADYSAGNFQYEVMAADGSTKVWTLMIDDFIKED